MTSFIIACEEESVVEAVEQRILDIPNFDDGMLSADGVEITRTDVLWIGNVTLLATKGFYRFGTWDELTGLADYAQAVRSD